LIALPWLDGDEQVVSYFNDEEAARAFAGRQPGESAMAMLGAWSDLAGDELDEWLELVRLERKPIPEEPEEREILAEKIISLRRRFADRQPRTTSST
jgi:uracil-DNA glycosylase